MGDFIYDGLQRSQLTSRVTLLEKDWGKSEFTLPGHGLVVPYSNKKAMTIAWADLGLAVLEGAQQSPEYRRDMIAALAAMDGPTSDGARLIAAERQRQMDVEGWTPEHDAEHRDGSLVEAAVMYARYGTGRPRSGHLGSHPAESPPLGWPWEKSWWKPTPGDPIRPLVKAGALIAAEIDRLRHPAVAPPHSPSPQQERLATFRDELRTLVNASDPVPIKALQELLARHPQDGMAPDAVSEWALDADCWVDGHGDAPIPPEGRANIAGVVAAWNAKLIGCTIHSTRDGEKSWAFWINAEDTTSYLHADMTVEWLGSSMEDADNAE